MRPRGAVARAVPGVVALVLAASVPAACGSSGSSATSSTTKARAAAAKAAPRPAGPEPSASAKMICSHEAEVDIGASLGVKPTEVSAPTWVDHVYACRYMFPGATIALSVQELDSAAQTRQRYDALATQLGRQPGRLALGDAAFQTANGSIVVRKDWKVLLVDVTGVPAPMGEPPLSAGDAALSVALTVLSCWTGA